MDPSLNQSVADAGSDQLTQAELIRYSRHTLLKEIGIAGQKRLKRSRVLVVGLGGLGSPLAMYLAAAGVGTLGLVEFDTVDSSNLQRQLLFDSRDVGKSKLQAGAARLRGLNPDIHLDHIECRLSAENALELVSQYDVVVDGTDNFPTRYLVNDACVLQRKPNVHGSIFRFEGQCSVFHPPEGPCYRCLYPEPPPAGMVPNCAEAGVLGILPGIIGTIQATETIKLLLGLGKPLTGRLLLYDALEMSFRQVRIRRDPQCPICGENPTITELIEYEATCDPTENSQSMPETPFKNLTPQELKERLDQGEKLFVLDVRQPEEYAICRLEGSTLIPLGELPQRIGELDPSQEIVVHCKMGGRSAQAAQFLCERGFSNVWNLAGGINAWSQTVDPSVPQY